MIACVQQRAPARIHPHRRLWASWAYRVPISATYRVVVLHVCARMLQNVGFLGVPCTHQRNISCRRLCMYAHAAADCGLLGVPCTHHRHKSCRRLCMYARAAASHILPLPHMLMHRSVMSTLGTVRHGLACPFTTHRVCSRRIPTHHDAPSARFSRDPCASAVCPVVHTLCSPI